MKRLLLACLIGAATPSLTLAAGPGGGGVEVALDESVEELAQELGPPGEPPATDLEAAERARHISKGLRCPICQGSSIQDSPVESATNMRNRVREMVDMGFDQEQINAYFLYRHGESILLAPPAAGLNWLVWVGPALAGGLALAVLAGVAARWRKEPDAVPLPSETGDAPLDAYEQRLLDEIDS